MARSDMRLAAQSTTCDSAKVDHAKVDLMLLYEVTVVALSFVHYL